MVRERRLYPRNSVNWRGQATVSDGPSVEIRVLDVSAGGARLELPPDIAPRRCEVLELTAMRRAWPFNVGKSINATGRVVRVSGNEEGSGVTVGVRFHTPLRESRRLTGMLRFPLDWAFGPNAVPCA